jgi:hypothetical protein
MACQPVAAGLGDRRHPPFRGLHRRAGLGRRSARLVPQQHLQLAHAARLRGRRQDSEFHLQVAGAERIRDVLGWEPSLKTSTPSSSTRFPGRSGCISKTDRTLKLESK